MDPNALAAAQPTGGLIEWITVYGNVVAFFAQLLYWVALIVLLGYAVFQFKRWVNYTLGTGRSGKLRTGENAASAKPADKAVSVEEFVE